MAHKVLFLNGPPGCGKDTAAEFIYKEYVWEARLMKMSAPLKQAARALYGIRDDLWNLLETSGSQEEKDKHRPEFMGHTWRQVLILLSEEHAKNLHGDDFFGRVFARQMMQSTSANLTVVSDCGFAAEVCAVAHAIKPENCYVMQITRPGHDFTGDSRSFISALDVPAGVSFIPVNNSFERDMFRRQVLIRVNKIMGGERTYD